MTKKTNFNSTAAGGLNFWAPITTTMVGMQISKVFHEITYIKNYGS